MLDLFPFRAVLKPQEMEGDRLDQGQALDAVPELAGGLERQRRAIRMADEMERASGLLGESQQDLHVGLDAEGLVDGPGIGLAVTDEVRREHAPVVLQRLDERQPFFVRGAGAMAEQGARPLALVEIGDVDAVDGQMFHQFQGPPRMLEMAAATLTASRALSHPP